MNTISPQRSAAIRELLVDYVSEHPARRRAVPWGTGLVLVGVIAGAGISAGAFAVTSLLVPGPEQPNGQPSPDLPAAVAAAGGIIPGAPMIENVGAPTSVTFNSAISLPLTDRPESATHARVTITPNAPVTGPGTLSFGTTPDGNNPVQSWTEEDLSDGTAEHVFNGWNDFPLDSSVTTLYIEPSGFQWVVTVQYVTYVPTEFGVNANGDSFGITGSERGEPTLIAVMATNGKQGYVYRTELEDANGTTAAKTFEDPADALAWQDAHTGEIVTIPVFESDGETEIGEFTTGG